MTEVIGLNVKLPKPLCSVATFELIKTFSPPVILMIKEAFLKVAAVVLSGVVQA